MVEAFLLGLSQNLLAGLVIEAGKSGLIHLRESEQSSKKILTLSRSAAIS